jgi:predicted enzyme related to lactoylglutathione lyase
MGLKVTEIPFEYWIEYEVGSQTFAVSNAWEPSGQSGPSVAFEVEHFHDALKHLKGQGVKIVADCIETPGCRMALIEDWDGNGITIHKMK